MELSSFCADDVDSDDSIFSAGVSFTAVFFTADFFTAGFFEPVLAAADFFFTVPVFLSFFSN
ncbi:MAG: hypothetical protein CVV49_16660 [Spirochaetae bacterium HGW-Spirochaetae-5]|nr:MAG: hypothetical protein CVV49_16660 [Spirochaetae bacterium HGW-Spirochaetae-5]